MTEEPTPVYVPPTTVFKVWTLDENGRSSEIGGAPDLLSAAVIAAAVASTLRVGVVVVDESDAEVAFLALRDG